MARRSDPVKADLRRIRSEMSKEIEQARRQGRLRRFWRDLEARVRRAWSEPKPSSNGHRRRNGRHRA